MEYQSKLDHAQTLTDQGGLTDDDFAELDDLMTNDVPDAVRSRLPGSNPAYRADPEMVGQGMSSSFDPAGFDFTGITKGK
ncbi:hypothetical protein [uncultured Roseobacter sp.]|uniref:hypothetical protein n=1 Tax=uncultured Roseobacter sp. TaxID=114847 RepID=UPI002624A468|nr:hypothetical protein [uncultured Roseobacter sp.]